MSNPTEQDWVKLKRLTRYLKDHPRCVIKYEYQEYPDALEVWVDSDFAGCKKSRKSTSGRVVMFGHCPIKTWSTNQAVIALSSGEAEYYAIVKGTSVGIGIVNMLCDLGMDKKKVRVKTDSSAAVGIAHRLGAGKVRHIEVNQLWVQEKVITGVVEIVKVDGKKNLADAPTKPVGAEELKVHTVGLNLEIRTDRHRLAAVAEEVTEEGFSQQMESIEEENAE